jgi:hypothetical protein
VLVKKLRVVLMMEMLAVVTVLGFNLVTARADWESTLAAAKKEGKVSVMTDITATMRDALTLEFQKKYGIAVELLGTSGREVAPRVAAERKAGQFLWDIYIHGSTTALEAMIPMGAFDPLETALIVPDVKYGKTWRGGAMEFLDPTKLVMVMTPFHRGTIFYNTKLVNAQELNRTKICSTQMAGSGDGRPTEPDPAATFTFFYLHPELGPDFIRALGKQQITILRDYAQEVDAVGQGRYPVLIGAADFVAINRAKQGVPIAIVDARQQGTDLSPTRQPALFNRAPNPNAAKVISIGCCPKKDRRSSLAPTAIQRSIGRADGSRSLDGAGSNQTYTKTVMQVKDTSAAAARGIRQPMSEIVLL